MSSLDWVLLLKWPGEIAEGNGTQEAIIDQSANDAQREALDKILHGESTKPGATHFFVYNSTMSKVLETRFEPIELSIDVDERQATLNVPGVVTSKGSPIISAFSGEPSRSRIDLPDGFEYTVAEMGNASSQATGDIQMTLEDSYGQFNILHMNQDGVIR